MKKITISFLIFLSFLSANAQLSEDFNGTSMPEGWAIFDNGLGTGGQNWTFYSSLQYMIVIGEPSGSTANAQDWLVTPQFTVDATNHFLSFDQADYLDDDMGSVYTVRVSTVSQTNPTDFTIVDTQTEADLSHGDFSNHTVDLSAYVGQAIYVAFVLEQNNGDMWGIDNVQMAPSNTAATESFEQAQIKLYPNPVVTTFNIDSTTGINAVSITDILGKVIYNTEINGVTSSTISLESLEKGLYLVTIYTNGASQTFRVIKK